MKNYFGVSLFIIISVSVTAAPLPEVQKSALMGGALAQCQRLTVMNVMRHDLLKGSKEYQSLYETPVYNQKVDDLFRKFMKPYKDQDAIPANELPRVGLTLKENGLEPMLKECSMNVFDVLLDCEENKRDETQCSQRIADGATAAFQKQSPFLRAWNTRPNAAAETLDLRDQNGCAATLLSAYETRENLPPHSKKKMGKLAILDPRFDERIGNYLKKRGGYKKAVETGFADFTKMVLDSKYGMSLNQCAERKKSVKEMIREKADTLTAEDIQKIYLFASMRAWEESSPFLKKFLGEADAAK